jgi:hypothetical protein
MLRAGLLPAPALESSPQSSCHSQVQVQSRRFNGPCVEITIKFDNITGQDPRDAEQRVAIAMGNVT